MATRYQAAAQKLDEAFAVVAAEDGFLYARDYRDEGFLIGDDAFLIPAADRDTYIDNAAEEFPEGDVRYLVAVAADFRVEELIREQAKAIVKVAA